MSRDKVMHFVDWIYDVAEDIYDMIVALGRRGYRTQKQVLAELPAEVVDEITPKTGIVREWKCAADLDAGKGMVTMYYHLIWRIWMVDIGTFTYSSNLDIDVDLPEYDLYTANRGGLFKRRAIYEWAANIKPELNRVNMERYEKQFQREEEHYR